MFSRETPVDEHVLLRAICETPEDDAPRLAYADWLEERGQTERAELIRVQIERALGNDSRELREREATLLRTHGRTWLAEMPEFRWIGWDQFERGFPSAIRTTWETLKETGASPFKAAPITSLQIVIDSEAKIPSFEGFPFLEKLRGLSFTSAHAIRGPSRSGRLLAARIAATQHLGGLRQLDLALLGLGDEGVRELAESPYLRNLDDVCLSANQIGPRGAEALVRSANFANVSRLTLSENRLGAEGARILASHHFRKLEFLYLNRNQIDPASQKILRRHFGRGVCRF